MISSVTKVCSEVARIGTGLEFLGSIFLGRTRLEFRGWVKRFGHLRGKGIVAKVWENDGYRRGMSIKPLKRWV